MEREEPSTKQNYISQNCVLNHICLNDSPVGNNNLKRFETENKGMKPGVC